MFNYFGRIAVFTIIVTSLALEGIYPHNLNISDIKIYNNVDYSSLDSIVNSLLVENTTDKEKALTLYEFVKDSMYHRSGITKSISDDWIAFLIAKSGLWPPARKIVDPIELLSKHHAGLCGQHAYVLYALAKKAGLDARIWELNGHIITEIYYDGAWHVFDADQEVLTTMKREI